MSACVMKGGERAQLRLTESRLEQATRWESHTRELAHHGRVPMEEFIAAQDGALMRQSDVVTQRAALKVAELGLAQAQREISSAQREIASDRPPTSLSERRLAAMEQAVRTLRQETEHVKFDLRITVSSDRR